MPLERYQLIIFSACFNRRLETFDQLPKATVGLCGQEGWAPAAGKSSYGGILSTFKRSSTENRIKEIKAVTEIGSRKPALVNDTVVY